MHQQALSLEYQMQPPSLVSLSSTVTKYLHLAIKQITFNDCIEACNWSEILWS